jgi:hypothetical protein
MCICTEKKSKESSLLRIVFAHAEENRHALVYENVYTLSLSLFFFFNIMLIAVGVQTTKKKEKRRKKIKTRVNSP